MTDIGTARHLSGKSKSNGRTSMQIWNGLRKGRQEDLSKLYHKYYWHLYKYGINIVHQKELIRDCIQELFLSLWDHHEALDHARSVKSYLFCSLRRRIFRKLKKQKNRYKRNREYITDYTEDSADVIELIEELELRRQKRDKLEKALDTLTSRQKEIIKLKYYEGLSSSEISCLLDINKQSVYNHVSVAIKKMKQSVGSGTRLPVPAE
ncbi:MAG: sigma-70 family RNA polymerase sigma factor [Balneolaceae bacterium]|nr:sigma-70 family RNA polymerase sigma factor [Balneolaceae bacterium]